MKWTFVVHSFERQYELLQHKKLKKKKTNTVSMAFKKMLGAPHLAVFSWK